MIINIPVPSHSKSFAISISISELLNVYKLPQSCVFYILLRTVQIISTEWQQKNDEGVSKVSSDEIVLKDKMNCRDYR